MNNLPAACPYCGVIYHKPPTATRKCPECGNKVVRRKQGSEVRFLTEEQAVEYDAERKGPVARAKAIHRAEAIGLGETDYERAYQALTKQYGFPPPPADVFWRLANERIGQLADPRRGNELEVVFRTMAEQVYEEHRPYRHLLQRAVKHRLIWERERVASVEGPAVGRACRAVVSAKACCPECARLDGQTFNIDAAIKTMPLPPEDCSAEWCSCGWLVEPPPKKAGGLFRRR